MRAIGAFEVAVVLLFIGLLVLYPVWRIFSKAGFPGICALLMFVPGVNVIVVLYAAFAEWPIQRELRRAREELQQMRQMRVG